MFSIQQKVLYNIQRISTLLKKTCSEPVSIGADIVGVNCHFDPVTAVKTVKMMMEGVGKAGLKAHYMVQPLAYHTPDCNCQGFIDLPEFPFGERSCPVLLPD